MTDNLPTKEEWEEIRDYTIAEGWALDKLFAIIDAYGEAVRELEKWRSMTDLTAAMRIVEAHTNLRSLAERYGRKV